VASAVAAVGRGLRRLVQVVLAVVVLVGLYYAGGAVLVHEINTDPGYADDISPPDGGSTLVATMAALVRREVDTHGWVANDPAIFPSHLLDDMANFQRALAASTEAMVATLEERLAGDAAPSLAAAAEDLAAPTDLWTFDFARSWRPQKTTEQFYRDAADALTRFNAELAAGDVALSMKAASAAAIVADFAATLQAAAEAGIAYVDRRGGHWLDTGTDDRFQTTRGLIYARFLFLRALATDHPTLFEPAADARDRALARLERAMALGPWYVLNGPADGQWRPSHLAAQAAYTLQAARALDDIADALATDNT